MLSRKVGVACWRCVLHFSFFADLHIVTFMMRSTCMLSQKQHMCSTLNPTT